MLQPLCQEDQTDATGHPLLLAEPSSQGLQETGRIFLSMPICGRVSPLTVTEELCFLQLLHASYSFAVAGFPIGFLHPKTKRQPMS